MYCFFHYDLVPTYIYCSEVSQVHGTVCSSEVKNGHANVDP